MKLFRIMGRTLKATYEELFLIVGVSLLWWAGAVLVVTAAPATMGLHAVANRIANYRRSNIEFFWQEARRGIGRSWLAMAAVLVAGFLLLFNIWFYASAPGWMGVVSVLWLWAMFLFLMIAQYLFPLLNQQTEPDLRLAIRNAALLAVRSPLYSGLSVLFQILLAAASILLVLPILVLTPGMIALAQNFALTGLLEELGLASPPPTVGRE